MDTPVLSVADFVRWSERLAKRVGNPDLRCSGETSEVLAGEINLLATIGESARPMMNGTDLTDLQAAIDQLDAATKTLIQEKYSA